MAFQESDTLTVQKLLDAVLDSRIAIPVFQRSSVWGSDDVRKLLESAVRGLPLGLIVFWQPRRSVPGSVYFGSDARVPVDTDNGGPLLVLDGQQRIRSLMRALGGPDHSAAETADDGAAAKCLKIVEVVR